jgi:MFS superfamily sulfate permease-like transporter
MGPVGRGAVSEPGLVVYRFGVGLFYANATQFSDEVLELVDGDPPVRWFVLHAVAMDDVDYSGGQTLAELADELKERKVVFAVADANPQFRAELDRFGITAKIGAERIFDGIDAAREAFHATRGAAPEGER